MTRKTTTPIARSIVCLVFFGFKLLVKVLQYQSNNYDLNFNKKLFNYA